MEKRMTKEEILSMLEESLISKIRVADYIEHWFEQGKHKLHKKSYVAEMEKNYVEAISEIRITRYYISKIKDPEGSQASQFNSPIKSDILTLPV